MHGVQSGESSALIVLNMIVKDEEHCLARCLSSIREIIDTAVIIDTGSTDGTVALIHRELSGIPHRVEPRPWVDFAHNRTEAFLAAKALFGDMGGYALIIDADEELIPGGPGWKPPAMTCGVAGMWNTTPGRGRYMRPQFLNLAYDFYWQGAVHEELLCRQSVDSMRLEGATVHGHFDSRRNHDPDKFLRDAAILRRQPATPRNTFYLAKSLQDAGQLDRAKVAYRQRISMGGFAEEIWFSMFMVATILEIQGRKKEDVISAYVKAYQFRPSRAETLRALAAYQLRIGDRVQHRLNHEVADRLPMTSDVLFVDPCAYQPMSA